MLISKQIGVLLCGSGSKDGNAIHEAILTLMALDECKIPYYAFAPNRLQYRVYDHFHKKATPGIQRNMLVESARLVRGNIHELTIQTPDIIDGLIVPGGTGSTYNLFTLGIDGKDCSVLPEVSHLISTLHQQNKPQGFMCIAPVLAAKILGKYHPILTIGKDTYTANLLESFGAYHKESKVSEVIIDHKNNIASTAAYMEAQSIAELYPGIQALVNAIVEML